MYRIRDIVSLLIEHYKFNPQNTRPYKLAQELTHFEFLVLTILNQNTSDVLADRAFQSICSTCGRPLTPTAILSLGEHRLIELVKVSGMYRRKVSTILDLSSKLLSVGGEQFLALRPISEVYTFLKSVKGLGEKSIDVFLLFKRDYPTFPIDTHIRRVCERLGIKECSDYVKLRSLFLSELGRDVELLRAAHLVLIHHGRVTCKAVSPRCGSCPINVYCRFYLNKVVRRV